tara:strand:- start:112 stop:357 length:246 start_codon:yes stop_codon:yes gene_type:complete
MTLNKGKSMKNGVTIESNCWITPAPEGTYMPYDKAIDLAFKLSKGEQGYSRAWTYTTEINATTNMARVAVYDETKTKMGYL